MLVLTLRPKCPSVLIGGDIRLILLSVEPGRTARFGIEAPRDVQVDRQEVRERAERTDHSRMKPGGGAES